MGGTWTAAQNRRRNEKRRKKQSEKPNTVLRNLSDQINFYKMKTDKLETELRKHSVHISRVFDGPMRDLALKQLAQFAHKIARETSIRHLESAEDSFSKPRDGFNW